LLTLPSLSVAIASLLLLPSLLLLLPLPSLLPSSSLLPLSPLPSLLPANPCCHHNRRVVAVAITATLFATSIASIAIAHAIAI
jgi:hypothetical protein